jgi:pimeloyl-ACP methyl ester carboxylesterase
VKPTDPTDRTRPAAPRALRVRSGALSLHVVEHSAPAPGRSHVVLVHGYPDQQQMWDPVVGHLDLDALHVLTYDVRGAGRSGVPEGVEGYAADRLVDDLVAVVEATVPATDPVHLVGHDWGSIQLWHAVLGARNDPRLRGRIASYTSISGPPLAHVAALSRSPEGRRLRLARQLVHSWYVYAFQVPVLPELVWARGHRRIATGLAAAERREDTGHWGPELERNAVQGLGLYRANMGGRRRRRRPARPTTGRRHSRGEPRTDVPVQLVVPTRDRFVTPVLLEGLERVCSDLTRVSLDAGHWVTRTHPEQVARLIGDHVARHA